MKPLTDLSSLLHEVSGQLEKSIAVPLSRVCSTMTDMVNQRTNAEFGITGTQSSILFMVDSGTCLGMAELARELGINANIIARQVNLLEERGLLNRVRSIEDRRVVRLAATQEGQLIAAHMPAIFNSVTDKLLYGFTSEEAESLKSMLCRVLANSGEPAGTACDPAPNVDKKS